ncbi:MAG: heat-inducible transcription repressor [Actinomycetota bacterium]
MISGRALEVLRVIVEDYVDSREPVGSKSIVERHGFGVSAATIRNDMAALEEANLIHAPHTSAGRVPTDLGYRRFVDNLGAIRPLSDRQVTAIQRFLDESLDLDDFFARTVRLLSDLTNQVALVQYPTLGDDRVSQLVLVPVTPSKAYVVLITTGGAVDRGLVEWGGELDETTVADLQISLNAQLATATLGEIDARMVALTDAVEPSRRNAVAALRVALALQVDAHRRDRLVVAGTPSLVRADADIRSVAPVLDAIEEQVTLLRLFSEMRADDADSGVRIGREMAEGLNDTAIVSRTYSATRGDSARVAILGPTRMNYPLNMAAVEAVARYLSHVLGEYA